MDKRRCKCEECKAFRAKWQKEWYATKPAYQTWRGMKERCKNPNHKNYELYKDRWYPPWDDYNVFKEWVMTSGWVEGLTIDRIDPTQGYSPENCQWLTAGENTAKGNAQR